MSDILSVPEQGTPTFFRHSAVPGLHIRPATLADDQKLVTLIAESMPSNGVLLSFERKPSYFKATHTQYDHPEAMLIASDDNPEHILGMFNIGTRACFINGEVKPLRYVGDLRINKTQRGKGFVQLMMLFIKATYPATEILQAVFLNDNLVAKKVLCENRPGVPRHHFSDQVETYTLTGFKSKKEFNRELGFALLTAADIPAVNRFIARMADYYNFLPAYDFNGLVQQQPYWNGLQLNDFTVVRRGEQIVGLFGLWDQKPFKQTRIADYGQLIALARPVYNAWAKLTNQLILPAKGNTVNYLMLHSLLCNPYDVDLHENMLRSAYQQAIDRNCYALCFTLAQRDPRRDCSKLFISRKVQAVHAFHCFEGDPIAQFDQKRISYLECGRI